MEIYKALSAVMADISKEGISKSRDNKQQGYKFRGIDDVYNALSSILSKHEVLILPRVLNRQTVERETKSGGALFYTVLEVEFDLISGKDGTKHTIKTMGEAMDSGDKSTNKAMSAAFKYAAMQTFCIPTEGDNDADATTHDVKAAPKTDIKPSSGVAESLPLDQRHAMEKLADEVMAFCREGDFTGAVNHINAYDLSVEEKTFMWGLLPSDFRNKLKQTVKGAK